jgi:acyl carrier protein
MTRDQVIAELVPIMEDVFDEDGIVYADDLTAGDIPEWDSLSHIRFMVAVERAFSLRFSTGEIERFGNLGELVDAIVAKKAA